jgi:CTP synthase
MEFDKGGDFVIHYMEGQTKDGSKGGSMRLGAYDCHLTKGTLAHKIYNHMNISERHRHRLEVNNDFIPKLKEAGMTISGVNDKLNLVEVIELENHPFFIACQYHPEFKSRPFNPHPLFKTFVEAAFKHMGEK